MELEDPMRYVNGFEWGTPGISYCLWQGVRCCLEYLPTLQANRDYSQLWEQLGAADSLWDLPHEPLGFRQSIRRGRQENGLQVYARLPSLDVFWDGMKESFQGLAESGYFPELVYSCSYPFSVYTIDLKGVGLRGTLAESIEDLTDLQSFSVRRNPDLGGPLPSAVQNMPCLLAVDIINTSMNCRNPSSANPDEGCPVPPFIEFADGPILYAPDLCLHEAAGRLPAYIMVNQTVSELGCRHLHFPGEAVFMAQVGGGKGPNKVPVNANASYFNYANCECVPGQTTQWQNKYDGNGDFVGCYIPLTKKQVVQYTVGPIICGILVVLTVASCLMFRRSIGREVQRARLEFVKRRYSPGSLPKRWARLIVDSKLQGSPKDLKRWFFLCGLSRGHVSSQKMPVTIVVTDIEGSTDLWEWNPKVMQKSNDLHDRLLRKSAALFMGYEVTTEGDSFTFAFHEAADACAFCLHTQQALLEVDWPHELYDHESARVEFLLRGKDVLHAQSIPTFRGLRVRMGIATGIPAQIRTHKLTKRKEYIGEVLWRARSISDAPQGGQVLMDSTTFAMVRSKAALRELSGKLDLAFSTGASSFSMVTNVYKGLRRSYHEWRSNSFSRSMSIQSGSTLSSKRSFLSYEDSSARSASSVRSLAFSLGDGASLSRIADCMVRGLSGPLVLDLGVHRLKSALYAVNEEEPPEHIFQLTSYCLVARVLSFCPIRTVSMLAPGFFEAPGARESLTVSLKGDLGLADFLDDEGDPALTRPPARANSQRNLWRSKSAAARERRIMEIMPQLVFVGVTLEGDQVKHLRSREARAAVLDAFNHVGRQLLVQLAAGHESASSGGTFVIAFSHLHQALRFCHDIQMACYLADFARAVDEEAGPRDSEEPLKVLLPACVVVEGKPRSVTPGKRSGLPVYGGELLDLIVSLLAHARPGQTLLHKDTVAQCREGVPR
eukprot:CAMPEP_0119142580 /NCGR_PEP_ID=MMETSP1310-20130426/32891_1 /TAXON_ID=464262 /ORGANISM="Genus nov. species nov., Strain RCC2339" /LENGTH=946 /DNA_ID=CAMNT_0007134131 /DNA_START=38 /DNA_END=2875 /DNA_ORIENTATION=+